jgi:hypothetical protein
MKYKTQDPKFYIENNRLVGQSGPVPEDEPLFILRAQDVNAIRVLEYYQDIAEGSGALTDHLVSIDRRITEFHGFSLSHPERMKIPDTDRTQLHDGKP